MPRKKNEKFVADSMLGSVARKLRIFGFDTLYVAHVDDSEVLKIGVDQDRTILTADKEFFKRMVKARAKGVLVGGADELNDIVHILEKVGVKSVDVSGIDARCSMCNGILTKADKTKVESLPERIRSHHQDFFKCDTCGKIYWEGNHMRAIRTLTKVINSKLDN